MNLPNLRRVGQNWYFRRKVAGKTVNHRLPAPDAPGFREAYDRFAQPDVPKAARPAPGTFAALVLEYRSSSDFTGIPSAKTRTNYLRYLDAIVADHGHRRVDQVRPAHVYKMRDAMKDMPGKANNWLTVFRVLMSFAAKLDWRGDNPAAGIKALPLGEHEPWPADLLRVCLEQATPMTRMLIVSALCSGQRNSDIIRMQYGWINDGVMAFTQQKTGVDVAVPMHPMWIEELARLPRRSVTLLYDRHGKPFGTTGAVQSRMRDLMAMPPVQEVIADLVARETISGGQAFVFHGLRKNACCYLLELGLNDSQVGSMLGMSAAMVRHYGKRSRALMVAKDLAERLATTSILDLPSRRLQVSNVPTKAPERRKRGTA
jgi:integrase